MSDGVTPEYLTIDETLNLLRAHGAAMSRSTFDRGRAGRVPRIPLHSYRLGGGRTPYLFRRDEVLEWLRQGMPDARRFKRPTNGGCAA